MAAVPARTAPVQAIVLDRVAVRVTAGAIQAAAEARAAVKCVDEFFHYNKQIELSMALFVCL
jgi:hypothetical protein